VHRVTRFVTPKHSSYSPNMTLWQSLGRSTLGKWIRGLRTFVVRLGVTMRRRAILSRMKEADIVLASPRLRRLSPTALLYRALLGSRYVHSMLYVGGGRMIHTTAVHGVVVSEVPRRVFDRERYAVYRAVDLTAHQRQRVVAEALQLLDRKLDHAALITNIPSRWFGLRHPLLRLEKNRLWCSKLIADAYRDGAGIELVPKKHAGTITTEDLSRSTALERV
jgi:cell wall-associated NlpC family hydrolase